jgi:DNA-binding transcriptional LysR family regulator
MTRDNYNNLLVFIAIAREGSFTRAAAQLGVSQSALSHTMRGFETRLGVRLLNRTTRSVSPTEAGARLLLTIKPRFDEIEVEIATLGQMRDQPLGAIRITAPEHAADTILWPALAKLAIDCPDIQVEISVDYGLAEFVAGCNDADVRLGHQAEKDTTTTRISADLRMAVVGSPAYFASHRRPQSPQDLIVHRCINLRLPTRGGFAAWEFERDGVAMKARVDGQWTFNGNTPVLRAALAGFGLAYLPEDMIKQHVNDGDLKRVLKNWCPLLPGYHLYYPSRCPSIAAFDSVVSALRYRA